MYLLVSISFLLLQYSCYCISLFFTFTVCFYFYLFIFCLILIIFFKDLFYCVGFLLLYNINIIILARGTKHVEESKYLFFLFLLK